MNEKVEIIFGLLGGLAIFIFGMNMMSECLQKAAGEKMKSILAMLTRNPVMGVLAGALTTAVLQSSSATTVMAIGFVSAGLMTLPQAISIILGANIGTTMTAQLLAFKISDYILVIVFIGFIISFVSKSEKVKNIGQTIFAFGLLFLGIETMGDVMKPLASSPIFTDLIGRVADIPILGVAVGTLMTLVVQSSSATIAVLQNFASQAGPDGVTSIIGLTGAIPILLGDNIGTTITALLASIGQSKDAKRTALAHCTFNISGCLLFIWLIKPFAYLIQMISPKGPEIEVISRQIANAHTAFNITMTIIWIPLIWLLVKIVTRIIPDGKDKVQDAAAPRFLDQKLINQPAAALQMVARECLRCSDLVKGVLDELTKCVRTENEEQLNHVFEQTAVVEKLDAKINEYLADMFSAGVLTEEQATQTAGLMYVLSDVSRISSLSTDLVQALKDEREKNYQYSEDFTKDIENSVSMIQNMYTNVLESLKLNDPQYANRVRAERGTVLGLDISMRKAHMDRVSKGECSASLTAPFNDIMHCINRMGNSCMNIADAVAGEMNIEYFIHEKEPAKA
ncbi:Na/Pi cotransporter family protein [Butyricicoccus porcorum]|uniref:Na/Pi cotransporter n=1 Tax=Butyricicoccus porcorum TaxID=1945634 RepID=A0A252F4B0_9FIRM|nr:Na/Pi cotransporter family protein [Butyricicoccus porcorum]MCI6926233.1 Na/Pi cotransporter family protein [Butyricicoccus porcorum]MDD6987192.1 Na/Pi cotransporter family protein [Butyricicoccus porcorum]MDY4483254.1 Na/Pi cotransporter family protein [Butyricicoccus porcorum]OUM20561.1 Na/Pi cotransporter [Butyricicoccus porcorum]